MGKLTPKEERKLLRSADQLFSMKSLTVPTSIKDIPVECVFLPKVATHNNSKKATYNSLKKATADIESSSGFCFYMDYSAIKVSKRVTYA
jgi:hypothetical protein